MIFTKILPVIVSLIYLNGVNMMEIAKITATNMENCNLPCDDSERKAVCAYNKDEVCFRYFPSKCEMDLLSCIYRLNYAIYIDDYCELDAFKCKDEVFVQSPPVDKVRSAQDIGNTSKNVENY